MAVVSNPRDIASDTKISGKTATVAFYVLVGLLAIGIAVPAALMTADASMFEECFAAAELCAAR